ncbi:Metallo-dependent phosphatase-like protein [Paraphoma chrysanthemicola]|uniref:Metallo-dependent phosphatase-like protein n=1 Tax=Paraphoma chrysanthemicola TaxID=798071 RepID=A0A8K0R8K7_9PLEO|nr:Metallo-dependent phosphatase-like protein [Paraphoma chrysanthemicola]
MASATILDDNVITDLRVEWFSSATFSPADPLDVHKWHTVEKDLYLHSDERTAWLRLKHERRRELTKEDLVVVGIKIGKLQSTNATEADWESRPGGISILRRKYDANSFEAVTSVDVLFGADAVDPRPQWNILQEALQLEAAPGIPVARLTIRHGSRKPRAPTAKLTLKEDSTFKILQVSDTHMVTGEGTCQDAIDADGRFLPPSVADPLTVKFLGEVLDREQPDLVLFTGDQVHHDVPDSQSAMFKVVAPLIKRSIPWAAIFGNHDTEGKHALSRKAQMSILQDLPFSQCHPGPHHVDGTGNYYLQIHDPAKSSVLDLYLLDSHEQISSDVHDPDYDPIKPSQIEWFKRTAQNLRRSRKNECFHASMAFLHIPLPEFGNEDLILSTGQRREPTEGPSINTHFYDALAEEGVAVIGCGHDHVNNFCAKIPLEENAGSHRPWLCYGGGTGFGGYCSYGKERYHRRTRVYELNAKRHSLKTWTRVECAKDRVDELLLIGEGADEYSGKPLGESKAHHVF